MAKDEKLSVGFLFDDTLDSNDGVSQQVKRLGEWLSSHGYGVSYFCGQTNQKSWAGGKVYSLAKNIRIKFNGNRLSMPIISSTCKIKEALSEAMPDVLHVQMPYSPLMSGRVMAKAKSAATVGTFHILPSGWLSSFGARLLGFIQRRSLARLDEAISVSTNAAKFAKSHMGLDSIVIPNMVDLAHFEAGRRTKQVAGRVVFLGRLVERKGCRQLIEAFAQILAAVPNSELVVAGDGELRQDLEKLAKKLEIEEKVKFLGFIEESKKPALLASANVACFPALYGESFGVVLIEAMAAGAGVVLAGDNPGYRCVMEPKPELLVDPRDSQQLAQKLIELLADNSKRQALHKWQLEHVKQYDVNVVGQQVVGVYAKAIAKKAKTRA